jgi:hypothetical protein
MTNPRTSGRRCGAPGCEAPRKSYPSGRVATFCSAHESARVMAVKQRPVVDPVTGRTITANSLAWYTWDRKRKAETAGAAR